MAAAAGGRDGLKGVRTHKPAESQCGVGELFGQPLQNCRRSAHEVRLNGQSDTKTACLAREHTRGRARGRGDGGVRRYLVRAQRSHGRAYPHLRHQGSHARVCQSHFSSPFSLSLFHLAAHKRRNLRHQHRPPLSFQSVGVRQDLRLNAVRNRDCRRQGGRYLAPVLRARHDGEAVSLLVLGGLGRAHLRLGGLDLRLSVLTRATSRSATMTQQQTYGHVSYPVSRRRLCSSPIFSYQTSSPTFGRSPRFYHILRIYIYFVCVYRSNKNT